MRADPALASIDRDKLEEDIGKMNEEKRAAFSKILAAVRGERTCKLYFLNPGCTWRHRFSFKFNVHVLMICSSWHLAELALGKTFLVNSLLDVCRLEGKVAQAVAISGIAALALPYTMGALPTRHLPSLFMD